MQAGDEGGSPVQLNDNVAQNVLRLIFLDAHVPPTHGAHYSLASRVVLVSVVIVEAAFTGMSRLGSC